MGICPVAPASAQEVAGMFGQGRLHGVVTAGYGSAFGDEYAILGAGVSYYLIDGLAIGGAYETWRGGDEPWREVFDSCYDRPRAFVKRIGKRHKLLIWLLDNLALVA